MRRTRDIREQDRVSIPTKKDSAYKPVVRGVRKFNPLKIPKNVQKELPFASKPKLLKPRASNKPTLEQTRYILALVYYRSLASFCMMLCCVL
jgi:ribosome biogenesis protein BMS1